MPNTFYGCPYPNYGPWDFLGPLIGWIVVLFIVLAVLRAFGRGRWHEHWMRGRSAVDILKERYAKGELTKEQFETMKKDLEER